MRIALVTGGSRGIGRAIVEKLHSQGYFVYATYNSSIEKARELEKELGGSRISFYKLDLETLLGLEELRSDIEKNHGKLDVLVNNAGIFNSQPFEKIDFDTWERVLKVNLTGPFVVIKTFLEVLKKGDNPSIINLASLAGQTGNAVASADYVASKAGLIGLTKKLGVELAKYGIRVNAVAPSFVETDLVKHFIDTPEKRRKVVEMHPLKLIIQPADVAEVVAFLADPVKSRSITGTVISVNAGRYT